MQFEIDKEYHGFTLIEQTKLEELQSQGQVFYHQKSGATLITINNQDQHKAFSISFKTPPSDNTGVAHIVEHAVCCASRRYPLKDAFIEFEKGSLCTSLNACTYSDMTMYYGASLNDKDLMHLIEVYMDLVFHPLIHKESFYFKQEGWYYALRDAKEAIDFSGVVYHEMQSEYSDASTFLEMGIKESLFPDTPYRYDSGGVPEAITTLQEKDFLDFHKHYYTASNCTLYLYGDGQLEEQMALLDEQYLSKMVKEDIDVYLPLQQPFDHPKREVMRYPSIEKAEDGKDAILNLSFVIGTAENVTLRLAFEIVEHMLLKSAASPLAKALVGEQALGKSLEEGGYDCSKRQPTFSITLKGTSSCCEEDFKERIFKVLTELVREGIDEKLLLASIHTIEFALKEGENPYEAKGILYSEMIQNSTLYGGEVFAHLAYKESLAYIKDNAQKGYFENLIKQYFLKNKHFTLILLEPSLELLEEREILVSQKLKQYKESLTKKELKLLIAATKALDQWQETPVPQEAFKYLPILKKEDLKRTVEPVALQKERIGTTPFTFQPYKTNGIVYIHLLLDTTAVMEEDIPYIGLLSHLLTYVSTKRYHCDTLENLINTHTGGVNCSINTYKSHEKSGQHKPLFKVSSKIFVEELPLFTKIMTEILKETLFEEHHKIKEIMMALQYDMKRSFEEAPEYRATKRLYTYFSWEGAYEEQVAGLDYYRFIKLINKDFDQKIEDVCEKLIKVYRQIMDRGNLTVSVTAEEIHYERIKKDMSCLIEGLKEEKMAHHTYGLVPTIKREGYLTSNSLQTVVKGFDFKKLGYPFNGQLYVVAALLESTYLWDKVRLQGGAYGCDVLVDREGTITLCSYADPHLIKTLGIYDGIGNFLRKLSVDEKELTKYIIGTIGALDMPLTAEQASERAISYHLSSITTEIAQKEREEILNMIPDDVKRFADLFDAVMAQDAFCIMGNVQSIKKQKAIFKTIDHLN